MAAAKHPRRAQRVLNDENGVEQSPQQILSTPRRKAHKSTSGKSLNATIRDETRDTTPTKKPKAKAKKSGTEKKQPSQPKKKTPSSTLAKKARIRNAQKQVKNQTENNSALPQDLSDIENNDSEDTENNGTVAATTRIDRAPVEEGKVLAKTRTNDTVNNSKSIKASPVNGKKPIDKSPAGAIPSASKPNTGLSDMYSRLSPQTQESPLQSNGSEVATAATNNKETLASPEQPKTIKNSNATNNKETLASPEQPKTIKNSKSKSKEQRALQEHGANEQKPAIKKSSLFNGKRKRPRRISEDDDEDDDDLDDDIPRKKKTARWSFKPDHEGHLALVPRAQVDPEDDSVVFVEGQEAVKLIGAEFERKKKVRFADRIAKQHPELTPEEKAAQQADLESQHLQVTTHGLFEKELSRNTDMRTLARKLDAGHKTMLEKVETLAMSNDEELRESLAKDLMDLAFAIRAAGPQSKDISPIEQPAVLTWSNPQDDKENKSTSTTPEHTPLQIEAPPSAKSLETEKSQTNPPTTTPGRIIASIRKFRSYLPFGGSAIKPTQSPFESVTERIPSSPGSPTPAPRNEDKTMPSSDQTLPAGEGTEQHNSKSIEADASPAKTLFNTPDPKREARNLKYPQFSFKPDESVWPYTGKVPVATRVGLDGTWKQKEDEAVAKRRRNSLESSSRKIGSELYPLTPNGKIPLPAPRVWGLNDAYFYEAEDSDDSDEEKEEEPLPKRRRITKLTNSTATEADTLRLTRSAPRPTTSKPTVPRSALKNPGPRVITVPDYSSDSDSDEEEPLIPSAERREKEREKMRAERLKNSMDAHQPKTPSRLREMTRAPRSPVRARARFQKFFKDNGTQGVLNVFAHV